MIVTSKSVTSKRRPSINKTFSDVNFVNQVQIPFQENYRSHKHSTSFNEVRRLQNQTWKEQFVNLFPKDVQEYLPEVNVHISILCLIWYMTSSVSSNLSKAILSRFPHPVGLTELQFLLSASLCLAFVTFANYLHAPQVSSSKLKNTVLNFPEGILPTYLNGSFSRCILNTFLVPSKVIWYTTFPMGIFQFVGHITSHKSTSLIPVSLVHSVKALSPIATVCYYRFAKGRQYNNMTYYTLIPLILGVIITCWTSQNNKSKLTETDKTTFSMGLSFAFISMVIFVSQNIFAKGILTVKSKDVLPCKNKSQLNLVELKSQKDSPIQLDKITILFYCSCVGFILTFPIFVSNEVFSSSTSVFADLSPSVMTLVLIHGVAHFFQAMLAFQLIGMLSPVTYSIANIMKRIVIIGVAFIWESNLSINQLFGLILTISGLYGYDKWGNKKVNCSL
ncbi:Sly41p [Kluyveromyces lactis]|uniref:KLLA0F08569p n=1 Tax=Kluyveromyces lactis (strain ATCC 8585 / CBS 2359 / DSM 70799 / NBRC 1267 / NRRL Y-1140 / WM37) TaxID=284590 RepID=Q6CKS0_KLULA|nr:uncharacterized protein KLLA0_F08569g [Kluyveromyces lactis]CAG98177.1 KLLA0F08569p [Kluyveromyces lactis]|eukprot:XP_455469.1 uncharacterized protein KLLA0_F08569g [Kluyveromyces lactis]